MILEWASPPAVPHMAISQCLLPTESAVCSARVKDKNHPRKTSTTPKVVQNIFPVPYSRAHSWHFCNPSLLNWEPSKEEKALPSIWSHCLLTKKQPQGLYTCKAPVLTHPCHTLPLDPTSWFFPRTHTLAWAPPSSGQDHLRSLLSLDTVPPLQLTTHLRIQGRSLNYSAL